MTNIVDIVEKTKTGRRGFLKGFGILAGSLAAAPVIGLDSREKRNSYLQRAWTEDGIRFLEYELPETVQALFKRSEGGRAIYCPIHNLEKEGKTPEEYIRMMKNHIDTHVRVDHWETPHCYIIRVKGRENLIGVMINQERLPIETNQYSVYE